MKIEKFKIEKKEPFAMVELNGKGCCFGGCNCSLLNVGDANNFI